MGDAGGEEADGLQAFGLDQAGLGLAKFIVGFAKLFVGGLELLFGEFARGDIPKDALGADDTAGGVVDGALDDVNVASFTGGGEVFLDGFDGGAAGDDLAVVGDLFAGEFGGEEVEVGAADNGAEGAAERGAEIPVREGEPAVEILAHDAGREGFDERMVEGFGFEEGELGAFAFDGVVNGTEEKAGSDLALDEEVLGAGVNKLAGEGVGVVAREDDDGDVTGVAEGGLEGDFAGAVREVEIEDDEVERVVSKASKAALESGGLNQAEAGWAAGVEQQAERLALGFVVLDVQDV